MVTHLHLAPLLPLKAKWENSSKLFHTSVCSCTSIKSFRFVVVFFVWKFQSMAFMGNFSCHIVQFQHICIGVVKMLYKPLNCALHLIIYRRHMCGHFLVLFSVVWIQHSVRAFSLFLSSFSTYFLTSLHSLGMHSFLYCENISIPFKSAWHFNSVRLHFRGNTNVTYTICICETKEIITYHKRNVNVFWGKLSVGFWLMCTHDSFVRCAIWLISAGI